MKRVWFVITDGERVYSTCGREGLSEKIKYFFENYSNHADIVIVKKENDDSAAVVDLDEAYYLLVKMDMIEKGRCTWSA